jgi:hypothetical protein
MKMLDFVFNFGRFYKSDETDLTNGSQTALVIPGFGICGFDYLRAYKLQITRGETAIFSIF